MVYIYTECHGLIDGSGLSNSEDTQLDEACAQQDPGLVETSISWYRVL